MRNFGSSDHMYSSNDQFSATGRVTLLQTHHKHGFGQIRDEQNAAGCLKDELNGNQSNLALCIGVKFLNENDSKISETSLTIVTVSQSMFVVDL